MIWAARQSVWIGLWTLFAVHFFRFQNLIRQNSGRFANLTNNVVGLEGKYRFAHSKKSAKHNHAQ